ncbi:hypothetical protein AVEN_147814-1 [Araneus ventricosus]|uniref:Uncharacterized protein n=1 Tax=Araneus ventricosus TaxID=182803 RepID=A0A4Y2LYH5_ARAVE|nr:hypothetical protein AVEN_147814-1 [Araneus ventricosus]
MTRATPELALPLQTSTQRHREDVWTLRMIKRATGPKHGGSSVESGFESGTLRSQSRVLATRLPRPYRNIEVKEKIVKACGAENNTIKKLSLNEYHKRENPCSFIKN